MKPPARPPKTYPEVEAVRLVWLAIFVSVFSFLIYYRRGDVLLYGDAVAHINIARRVFDSKTPGLLQLGTVWLPMPHLLIVPFIVSKQMWQSGSGGSIPSMAAYVLGVLGIFQLVKKLGSRDGEGGGEGAATVGAWAAAIIYAANPNLIYMQATAMGESLYLALFIWAMVYFAEFSRGKANALTKCGFCLVAACLTRYDGWFLAAVVVVGVLVLISPVCREQKDGTPRFAVPPTRGAVLRFILLAAAGPLSWFAYNAAVYRNPLEFVNGPYSAKAIEQNTATVNPAKGNLWAGGAYFVKAAELDMSPAGWQGRLWLVLALLGSAVAWVKTRGRAALLLWAPLPFYALSVAYGSVPIFVPEWWPFSIYNVRYGLQLLPVCAVYVPLAISFLIESAAQFPQVPSAWRRWAGAGTMLATLLLAASSYGMIWRADPICYREAAVNSRGLVALDREVAAWLKSLPSDSTLLMYLGQHSGALERAGIPFRRVIYEGNQRVWKRPFDPEGLWERALADPAAYADYVIGFQGDPVWTAAKDRRLTALVELHTTGQPATIIFQGRGQPQTQGGSAR